jgi:hypothetical protein
MARNTIVTLTSTLEAPTNHKHSENEHCVHIKHPHGGMYRAECSCGSVTRWCMTRKVAISNGQIHIRVNTKLLV